MSTIREAIRVASFYPTDRILGIGCHSRDPGTQGRPPTLADRIFQRPADAVIAGMFKALGVRTEVPR